MSANTSSTTIPSAASSRKAWRVTKYSPASTSACTRRNVSLMQPAPHPARGLRSQLRCSRPHPNPLPQAGEGEDLLRRLDALRLLRRRNPAPREDRLEKLPRIAALLRHDRLGRP